MINARQTLRNSICTKLTYGEENITRAVPTIQD